MKKFYLALLLLIGVTLPTAAQNFSIDNVMEDTILPIAVVGIVFACPIFIIFFVLNFRHRAKVAKYKILEQAIALGRELPKGFFEEAKEDKPYLKRGCVKVGTGIGLALMLGLLNKSFSIASIGLLVLFIGVGELIIAYFNGEMKVRQRETEQEEIEEAEVVEVIPNEEFDQ